MLHIMGKSVLCDIKRIWHWIEMLGFTSVLVTHNFTQLGD